MTSATFLAFKTKKGTKAELTCLSSADLVRVSYLYVDSYKVSAESEADERDL